MTPSPRRDRKEVNYADAEDDALGEDFELSLSDDDYDSDEDDMPVKLLADMKRSPSPKNATKKRKSSTPASSGKKKKKSTPKSSGKKKTTTAKPKKKKKHYLPKFTHEPKREYLGDPLMGMTLIHPPPKNHVAVQLLQEINAELKDPKVKLAFYNWARGEKPAAVEEDEENESVLESCREIQGGRIEIFLEAKDKSSQAFDYIIGRKLRKDAKEIVLEYCRRQADQDKRLNKGYKYENFSLLVSFYQRPAQVPHLDLVHPNYQFGVILSDQATGTHFVPASVQNNIGRVATVDNLEELWNTNVAFKEDNGEHLLMPDTIKKVFQQEEGAQQLLRYFGDTLIPEKTLVDSFIQREKIPTGTLCSLPGSIVHAGPRSSGLRSIIFFSGTPKDTSNVDPYLPDSQYNGVTLIGHLVSILWRRDTIEKDERRYLLKRLVQYIEGTNGKKEVWAQFGDGELKDFVKSILKETYKGTKEAFILKKAKCLEMSYGDDPFSKTDTEIDIKHMKCISVENLYTMWDGVELPVMVYRMGLHKKIVIRYLTKGAEDKSPDEYEGHRPEENLKFDWHDLEDGDDRKGNFDGTNGTLRDTDGELITMYVGSRVTEEEEEEEVKPKRKRKSKSKGKSKGKQAAKAKSTFKPAYKRQQAGTGGQSFRPMGGKRDIIIPPNLLTEEMICDDDQFCAARLRHHLLEYRHKYGVDTKIPCNKPGRREALLVALTKWRLQNESTDSKSPSEEDSSMIPNESGSTESKLPENSGIESDESESTNRSVPRHEKSAVVSDENGRTNSKLPGKENSGVVSDESKETGSKLPREQNLGIVSDESESKLPSQGNSGVVSDESESTVRKLPSQETSGNIPEASESKLPSQEDSGTVFGQNASTESNRTSQEASASSSNDIEIPESKSAIQDASGIVSDEGEGGESKLESQESSCVV